MENKMKKYSLVKLKAFFSSRFVPVFRSASWDKFYDFRTRKTFGIPISTKHGYVTEEEIESIFSDVAELYKQAQIAEFKKFINQSK